MLKKLLVLMRVVPSTSVYEEIVQLQISKFYKVAQCKPEVPKNVNGM